MKYKHNIICVQPALPVYRIGLFERLYNEFGDKFILYAANDIDLGALTKNVKKNNWSILGNPIKKLPFGLDWQPGVLDIDFDRDDIIIISGAPRNIATMIFAVKVRLKGAKLIWWGHYWSSTSKVWRTKLRYLMMKLANRLLFYTEQEIIEYKNHQGRKESEIFALNNGIENKEIIKLRKEYKACDREHAIFLIARFREMSQIDLLLNAMAKMSDTVKLEIIGDGAIKDDLIKLSEQLNIAERIIWHGPMTDEKDISAVANRCKVFVYPGSVGLSIIHGLTYGLPCIAHDDRWLHGPEITALVNGVNGLTFRYNDVQSLAETIQTLIDDDDALDAMSQQALATVADTYNTDDMARRFIRAINFDAV